MTINDFPKSVEITAELIDGQWRVTGFTTGTSKGDLTKLRNELQAKLGTRSFIDADAAVLESNITHSNLGYYMSSESFLRQRGIIKDNILEIEPVERRRIFVLF